MHQQHGQADQFGLAAGAGLLQDRVQLGPHGSRASAGGGSDPRDRAASCQQAHHLGFGWRKLEDPRQEFRNGAWPVELACHRQDVLAAAGLQQGLQVNQDCTVRLWQAQSQDIFGEGAGSDVGQTRDKVFKIGRIKRHVPDRAPRLQSEEPGGSVIRGHDRPVPHQDQGSAQHRGQQIVRPT
ncbi:hypothetical protein, partial [Paracoccus acridae]|uniref:hypothetical protein n=1 Tax=Paracoccus acridae TaxID=1795310 RepID=UPI001E566B40